MVIHIVLLQKIFTYTLNMAKNHECSEIRNTHLGLVTFFLLRYIYNMYNKAIMNKFAILLLITLNNFKCD